MMRTGKLFREGILDWPVINWITAGLLLRRHSVLLVVFVRTRSSAAAAPNSPNGVLPATWVARTFVLRFLVDRC